MTEFNTPYQIKSLHLENFKSFGERVIIPMAPITLILGENSAGKSTILKALHLLKQHVDVSSESTSGNLSPSTEYGIGDLGSIPELLFDHDTSRKLKFRLEFDSKIRRVENYIEKPFLRNYIHSSDLKKWLEKRTEAESGLVRAGLEMHFEYSNNNGLANLCQLEIFRPGIGKVACFQPQNYVSNPEIQKEADFEHRLNAFRDHDVVPAVISPGKPEEDPKAYHKYGHMQNTYVTDSEEFWATSFRLAIDHQDEIIEDLKTQLDQISIEPRFELTEKLFDKLSIPEHVLNHELLTSFLDLLGRIKEYDQKLYEARRTKLSELSDVIDLDEPDKVLASLTNDSSLEDRQTLVKNLTDVFFQIFDLPAPKVDLEEDWSLVSLDTLNPLSWVFKKRALKKAIKFYSTRFSIDEYISRMQTEQIGDAVRRVGTMGLGYGWGGFCGRFPERKIISSLNRKEGVALSNIEELAVILSSETKTLLRQISPIGPFRSPPERWYAYSGVSSPANIGYSGTALPELLFNTPSAVSKTNEWLNRLGVEYKMELVTGNTRYNDIYEIRFLDLRRKDPVNVNVKDLGFGISQILPVIVQSLVGRDQIVTIEQPEVHIHPRLQANLGDLFAESINKPDSPAQFIIETHSEHLVLRLQRLIRNKKLKADDVSVLYVSRGESGSHVERLRLDDNGEFIDEWPGGFFPERLEELL